MSGRLSWRWPLVVAWIGLFGLHAHLISSLVLLDELFDASPLQRIDYPLHYANALDAAQSLRETGHYWSYDPRFAAGFPRGVFDDPGNHASAIAVLVLGFLAPVVAFKLFVVVTFLSVPLLLGASARVAGLREPGPFLVATSGTLLWQADPLLYLFRWFGSFNFVNASVLALVLCALAARFVQDGGRWRLVGLLILAPAVLLAHPLSLVVMAAPSIAVLVTAIARRSVRRVGALALVGVVALAANGFWIWPVWMLREYKGAYGVLGVATANSLLDELWLAPGHGCRAVLLALAIVGWRLRSEVLTPAVRRTFASGAIALLAIVSGARAIPILAELQPARFMIPAVLLVVPLATDAVLGAMRGGRKTRLWTVLALLVAAGPFLVNGRPLVSPAFLQGQLRTAPAPGFEWLSEQLRAHVGTDRRVLFESGVIGAQAPFGGYVEPLLQAACGAEFVGPTYPLAPVVHTSVGLVHGELAGRPIAAIDVDELRAWLDRYDVGWVVVWSPAALAAMMREGSGLERSICQDDLCLFERTGGPKTGGLLVGSGVVRARRNVLEVDVDSPGEIVLNYHWLSTLEAAPRVSLRPYMIPDDPIGFIAFTAPRPGRYIISNAYRSQSP